MRIALFVLLAGCIDADAPVDPDRPEPFVFEVAAGSSASGLSDQLEDEGLVPSVWQWKLFLRNTDASCLKAGRFEVNRAMSMTKLLETLCGTPIPEDEPFTVLEGWRIRDIDAALADKGWIEPGAYAKLARNKQVTLPFEVTGPTLEGYLFPETYRVEPKRFTAKAFIERQLQTFHDTFLAPRKDQLGDRTLHDVVVMASMLEREEPKPSQRKVVAGILYKRLDASWNLGVDATSRYTLETWNDRKAFLAKLRDPDDPYNTRLRGGMPPTAIGNPGVESLSAALAPEDSPWWYYLHDAEGTFHGGRSSAEHEANRKRYNVY
jgi:UPF0755 protein